MKKPILAIIMMIVLLIPVNSPLASDTVTITYPDGTIVQMSVEDYLSVFMNISPDSTAETGNPDTTAAVPWPTYTLTKYPLAPKLELEATSGADDEFTGVFSIEEELEYKRVMAYLGPSRNYAETAAYKPDKMARTDGLFIEGSYVFVDMNYPSVGVRRTYFTRGTFKSTGSVPEVTLIGYPAVTTQSTEARYGPGSIYDPFPEASVAAGTALTVFFEEDGYVFAEYEAGFELVRAWIDAGGVAPR
jgi:hypothetical protein